MIIHLYLVNSNRDVDLTWANVSITVWKIK